MKEVKKNAVLYVRVKDTVDEAEKQLEALWFFTESKGFVVTNSYYEMTSGAAHVHERTIWHLLADAKEHKFETVVVSDISRITHKSEDALFVLNELKELGIEILSQHGDATLLPFGSAR